MNLAMQINNRTEIIRFFHAGRRFYLSLVIYKPSPFLPFKKIQPLQPVLGGKSTHSHTHTQTHTQQSEKYHQERESTHKVYDLFISPSRGSISHSSVVWWHLPSNYFPLTIFRPTELGAMWPRIY